ncbi:ABC transporter permease [Microlunatus sp. Y2014]|uniref:ABC transporter permease n=1 Tax=Microlunatus sp. Y2014 TaxID=3418488 RepID=UPI003DA6E8DA
MISFIVRRLAVSVVALLGISMALFALTRFIPGDPVSMYFNPMTFEGDREAAIAALRAELGLDQPVPVQYLAWLGQVFQGNLGFSITTGRPVTELIMNRLPATAYLMLTSLTISIVVGIIGGVIAALRKNTITDYATLLTSLMIASVPTFFIAMVGIYVFGLKLQWLPTAGINVPNGSWGEAIRHLVMPAGIMGISGAVGYIRWSRSSMLDVLDQDYMVTARSKGLSNGRVVVVHGLRNALIPLVTILAMTIPSLFGGSVIIEQIFAWPGTGRMAIDAISNRDYPVIMGFVMITTVLVLLCNLIADVTYAIIDPRIRL